MDPWTGEPTQVRDSLWRWPDGRLELGLEADLTQDHRIDWLITAAWLARELDLTYGPAFLSPIGDTWSVLARTPADPDPALQLLWRDFPDELVLRATQTRFNPLIERTESLLPAARPTLGELSEAGLHSFKEWFRSLGGS